MQQFPHGKGRVGLLGIAGTDKNAKSNGYDMLYICNIAGDYITSIMYKNKLPELNMPRSYIDPFSDTLKTFAKHCDLDAFCKNYAALPLMQKDFPADYLYLKILDRLFWIDWIAHTVNNDATIDPLLTKPEECSFGVRVMKCDNNNFLGPICSGKQRILLRNNNFGNNFII